MTEFTEGINTYRIVPIIMQNENADEFIRELLRKKQGKETITKEGLVRLTLCPLMGGNMEIKERLKAAYQITEDAESVSEEELRKIEAVIYAMADKFLESIDMEEFKEGMRMTKLGQMLVEDGLKQGRKEGEEETKMKIATKLIGLLPDTVVAEQVGISLEIIEKIKQKG